MAARTLILVRHGQYHLQDEHARHGRLTPLGERQAKRLAKRLSHYTFNALHTSTAPRALETAAFVAKHHRGVSHTRSPLLLEGVPSVLPGMSPEQRARVPAHRARMEKAFARYFRPTRGKDRTELLIFHGNILRYLLRCALGDVRQKWSRFAVMHCSISIVQIEGDGSTRILALNDVGHLPRSMQTFA